MKWLDDDVMREIEKIVSKKIKKRKLKLKLKATLQRGYLIAFSSLRQFFFFFSLSFKVIISVYRCFRFNRRTKKK